MHFFDASVLSQSIPFEKSIFSCGSIFITHTKTCVKNVVDNIYHFFHKQMQQQLSSEECLEFYLKANYHLIQT